MATETITLDPTSEDSSNYPLELFDTTNGFTVRDQKWPFPEIQAQAAGSVDTDGDPVASVKYGNREITITVRVFATTNTTFYQRLQSLQSKLDKINREGGTLKRVLGDGATTLIADLFSATMSPGSDPNLFPNRNSDEITLVFGAATFVRGPAETKSDHAETSNPCIVWTETDIPGDAPALGRLVVDEDDGDNQWFLMWGLQSRYYPGTATADTTAALFYEAEGRLPLGGATLTTRSGASGGTVVRQATLTNGYQAMLSLASSGTAYPSHVGSYRVWARVYDPGGTAGVTSGGTAGNVQLRLEWAQGDFVAFTANDPVSPPVINNFSLVNLGLVHLDKAVQGTQRWEGRIAAKGTDTNQSVDVDSVFIVPIDDGYGEARGVTSALTPTSFTIADEFDQSAGNLNAKNARTGGAWTTSGDATDLAVEATGHTAQRSEISDTAHTGRLAIIGSSITSQASMVDFKWNTLTGIAGFVYSGLVLRYVDANNYYHVLVTYTAGGYPTLEVWRKISGSFENVFADQASIGSISASSYVTLKAQATATGQWSAWFGSQGSDLTLAASGYDSNLDTGGTLASGKVGFYDENRQSTAVTRNYDNFYSWTPVFDAAVYAGQSLELRHDRVLREDSTGVVWAKASKYEGSYLLVPPTRGNRSQRFILKASRGDPDSMADSGIDDISARLTVTPRYLYVPEP